MISLAALLMALAGEEPMATAPAPAPAATAATTTRTATVATPARRIDTAVTLTSCTEGGACRFRAHVLKSAASVQPGPDAICWNNIIPDAMVFDDGEAVTYGFVASGRLRPADPKSEVAVVVAPPGATGAKIPRYCVRRQVDLEGNPGAILQEQGAGSALGGFYGLNQSSLGQFAGGFGLARVPSVEWMTVKLKSIPPGADLIKGGALVGQRTDAELRISRSTFALLTMRWAGREILVSRCTRAGRGAAGVSADLEVTCTFTRIANAPASKG